MNLIEIAVKAANAVPDVYPYLSGMTRLKMLRPEAYKSEDFFLANVERLVRSLYSNQIGGEFIDIMANLISGQIRDAYEKAYFDAGYEGELPAYLETAYQDFVLGQYDFVDRFFRDIIDARIDGKPIDSLINRARLWAGRWTEAYQQATILITKEEGGNMEWVYGDTEHCNTCQSLNGIVASAREWDASGFQPQGRMLDCKGYNCQCELKSTDKRRSPKAFDRIVAISLDRK